MLPSSVLYLSSYTSTLILDGQICLLLLLLLLLLLSMLVMIDYLRVYQNMVLGVDLCLQSMLAIYAYNVQYCYYCYLFYYLLLLATMHYSLILSIVLLLLLVYSAILSISNYLHSYDTALHLYFILTNPTALPLASITPLLLLSWPDSNQSRAVYVRMVSHLSNICTVAPTLCVLLLLVIMSNMPVLPTAHT